MEIPRHFGAGGWLPLAALPVDGIDDHVLQSFGRLIDTIRVAIVLMALFFRGLFRLLVNQSH